jgi:hypothetical protein
MCARPVDLASGRVLRQRAFAHEVDAESADAAGGRPIALARAAQQAADALLAWAAAD